MPSNSKVIWLGQKYTEIDGTSKPHSYFDESNQTNEVAALRIKSTIDGAGVIIEGRPDEILATAREILRTAELIVEQTMRDPTLRRMYGIIGESTEDWERLSTDDVTDMSEQFAADAEAIPVFGVGDPDPTPDDLPYCGAAHEGFTCTWRPGHDGPHVAGARSMGVAAVWSNHA